MTMGKDINAVRAKANELWTIDGNPAMTETLKAMYMERADSIINEEEGMEEVGYHFPNGVVTIGSGPYAENDFDEFLKADGINVYSPTENTGILVVGREWGLDILDQQITLRENNTLFVYSQEMFLSRLAGKDPYDDQNALKIFAEGHPLFEYLNERFVEWPTTHIVQSKGSPPTSPGDWPLHGVLDDNGYHVGNAGVEREERHRILTRVFKNELRDVTSAEYMEEWNDPNTGKRLQKLANTLASLARVAQRRRNPPAQAIEDWIEDLAWLKRTYHHGVFMFEWPGI